MALFFVGFNLAHAEDRDKRLYELPGNAMLVSHQFYDDIPVEAAVLSATHSSFTRLKKWPPAGIVLFLWGVSELLLTLFKHSKSNAASKDRNSLRLIWLVNLTAIALAIIAAYRLREFRIPWPDVSLEIGYCLFVPGLVMRWYSIIYLGRFFTTNVAIATDHRLIDSGPYRFIRHPSYAGNLVAMLGLSLTFCNWASLLIFLVPCTAVQLWRIHIEEKALVGGLGEQYRAYMQRTKRLIPWVY